jgi:RNA:NAD 2'-phosphotransferase (TPT1/KptA family)
MVNKSSIIYEYIYITHRHIRAVQGHTIKTIEDDLLLVKITDPHLYPVVVHGTDYKAWEFIKASGLKTMGRNHVHFAIGMPGEE